MCVEICENRVKNRYMVNLGFVLHHVFKTWKFATFMQECISYCRYMYSTDFVKSVVSLCNAKNKTTNITLQY